MENSIAVKIIAKVLKMHGVVTYPFAAEPEVRLVPGCRVVRMTNRLLLLNTESRRYKNAHWDLCSDQFLAALFINLDIK